jgi:hypothetical protein
MAGARARVGSGAILLALVVFVPVLAPPPIRGADETAQVLPGEVGAAVVADIDGDGARELVRILNEGGDVETVDAWGYDGARWSLIGSASLAIAVESQELPAEDVATRVDIAEALLVWHADGTERVLVLTARTEYAVGTSPPVNPCCLSIFELRSHENDIALLQLPYEGIAGQFVQVLDVDADGTDELVVSATAGDADNARLEVLRWSGTAFETAYGLTGPDVGYGVWIGDSDGLGGDDLLFGPTREGDIQRVTWLNGELHAERGNLELREQFIRTSREYGWIAGIAGGRLVVLRETEMSVVRWPRDAAPEVVSRVPTREFPGIWVLGTDADALVLTQDNFGFGRSPDPPTTIVYDLELRRLGEVETSAGSRRLWSLTQGSSIGLGNLNRGIFPFVGPLWGATDGRQAFIASGTLIQAGDGSRYEVQAMASLPGLQPIGTAGPSNGWVVLTNAWVGPPNSAYLYPGGVGSGRISLAPMADVLRPDGARPALELRNAVEPGDMIGGVRRLLAAGAGFSVVLEAPDGSYVVAKSGLLAPTRDYDVSAEPLVVEFAPRRNSPEDENQSIEASLLLITPDGRASFVSWGGTYLREPPELTVAGRTDSMALSATLAGRASDGATVTVDGRLVASDANGAFEASVDAPIWPRRVMVVARDPFGRETMTHLEVVGVHDYRGFPWAAMVVAATVAVGATLFVRTPRRKPAAAAARAGDARLEELELEDLEELTRAPARRR